MKTKWVWGTATAAGCVALVAYWLVHAPPPPPVALIRIVDAAGKPVPGAVVHPYGLRPKAGPYASTHYFWVKDRLGVPDDPVTTDAQGVARVPYPRYVLERIETGQISITVKHPDYVSTSADVLVSTSLPAGAPLAARARDLWDRIRHKALLVQPDPVTLQRGAVVIVTVAPDSPGPKDTPLYAQATQQGEVDPGFWVQPEPGTLISHGFAAGLNAVRAIRFDAQGSPWFSDTILVTTALEQTNRVTVTLKRGVAVRGRLDATVPRPVKNGRVIAHICPPGHSLRESPPDWHAWAAINADGEFELASLPEGDLEIAALCAGFVSTNGTGQTGIRCPQKHLLGTHDLSLIIGMEPTARLEVRVTDDRGAPLKGARVFTWPNIRYGDWSSTVLASDCYNTAERLLKPGSRFDGWSVPDFEGTTDAAGVAILPNLPAEVTEFSIEHPGFVLSPIPGSAGAKSRVASVSLTAGATNHASVRLEPKGKSTIRHY